MLSISFFFSWIERANSDSSFRDLLGLRLEVHVLLREIPFIQLIQWKILSDIFFLSQVLKQKLSFFSPINKEFVFCISNQVLQLLMNMRQLHIIFNSAKTWHVIVCWFLCFPLNLPELNLKLFWTSEQNNFRLSSGKFRGKHWNQQTITWHVKFWLNWIKYGVVSYSLICIKNRKYVEMLQKIFCRNMLQK